MGSIDNCLLLASLQFGKRPQYSFVEIISFSEGGEEGFQRGYLLITASVVPLFSVFPLFCFSSLLVS